MRKIFQSSPAKRQAEMPYVAALSEQASHLPVRGQAPGHHGDLPGEFERLLGEQFAHVDLSVVKGLDVSLHGRPTPLVQAEQLLADAVEAKAATFFTSGATAAASALTSALLEVARGRKIAVARNAHVSVINTLTAAGAAVVFLPVEVHPILGMATVLDPGLLEAILANGDIGGVLITSPCYEGVLADIATCIRICHGQPVPVPVVVDNSWGSEMPFSDLLGESPLALGADAVVGSPHKTLRAPGQAAWAFLGKASLIPLEVFEIAALRHKTTSKSSIFLGALDLCRRWSFFNASPGIERNLEAVDAYSRLLPAGMLVDWRQERRDGRTIAPASIPYRMTIETWKLGYTGYEVAELLRKRGVQVAQANIMYLFVGTGVDAPETIKALLEAVASVLETLPHRAPLDPNRLPKLRLTQASVDFNRQRHASAETVPLKKAVGRPLADPLGAYPPGFEIKVRGEVLDEHTAEYLDAVVSAGGTVYGGSPRLHEQGLVRVLVEA